MFNRFRLYFRNNLERDLSIKMLRAYMNRPYTNFLDVNSSEVMRGINGDNAAVATMLDSYSTLFNEGLTCLMLGIMLVILNPIMALGITVLAGGLVITMVLVLKKRVGLYSVKSREAFGDRYRYSYESINGIKEIDVMKRQDRFLSKFAKASIAAADNNTKYLWIAMLPSRLTETIFISGLVVIVIISFIFANDMSLIAAQLSALGVAAVRILPSVSNMLNAMNSMVFQRPAFENAYNNLVVENIRDIELVQGNTKDKDRESTKFEHSISIENISWKYKNNLPNVLDGLSMRIKKVNQLGL